MQELVLQRWEGVPPLLGDAQTAKIRLNRPILTEAALSLFSSTCVCPHAPTLDAPPLGMDVTVLGFQINGSVLAFRFSQDQVGYPPADPRSPLFPCHVCDVWPHS